MHISWARLASFCQLGFISDPLIVSKFHNETHDPKEQENKIYTIVKGTFIKVSTIRPIGQLKIRLPDKGVKLKLNFLIFQPKHMLWVLKRTISLRHKTCIKTNGLENIHNFMLEYCVYLDLCLYAHLTLCLLVSSAHNLCKQIGPRSGLTKCRT